MSCTHTHEFNTRTHNLHALSLQVLDAMSAYYRSSNANVHRGAHALSVRATEQYEGARDKVAKFVNAERSEIVFTSGEE